MVSDLATRAETPATAPVDDAAPSDGPAATRLPDQDTRRGVGHCLLALSVALDAAALLVAPAVLLNLKGGNKKIALLYIAIAMVLLIPTYRRGRAIPQPSEHLATLVGRLALAPMITGFVLVLRNSWYRSLELKPLAGAIAVSAGAVLVSRFVSFVAVRTVRRRGYDLEDTLIVGAGPVGVDVSKALSINPEFGLVPVGFVDRFDERLPHPIVGRPEDLRGILEHTGVRHVVLAFGAASEEDLVGYVRECRDLPVQFYTVPRFFELGSTGHEVDGFPLVPIRRQRVNHHWWRKRMFDIVVAGGLLLVSSPLFVLVALAVKRSSPGPVFFRQVRVGLDGQPFEILKFRSMRVNDDSTTQWSVDEDDRVTRVGAFIRKTHLDELPQLVNVLRGEMSIVGPRPERPYFVEQFGTEIDGYHHRHRVPVGITGWAQVNGYWGDTSIETRVRLDNRYIENWSLWRDLVIGLRTIPTLLGKRR